MVRVVGTGVRVAHGNDKDHSQEVREEGNEERREEGDQDRHDGEENRQEDRQEGFEDGFEVCHASAPDGCGPVNCPTHEVGRSARARTRCDRELEGRSS